MDTPTRPSQQPITIVIPHITPWLYIQCSYKATIIITLLYIGACCNVFRTSLPLSIQYALILLALGHWLFIMRQHIWLQNPSTIISFRYDGDHWELKTKSGKISLNKLHPDSRITQYFLLLHLHNVLNQKRTCIMLCYDSLPKRAWRILRIAINMNQQSHL